MPDVNMPKLSDTMEEGTVLEWKKKDGDEVHKGEVLAEVESDKATFDLEAEDDGVLSIKVEKGVPAKIGAPIATIGAASEAKPAKADGAKADGAKAEKPKAKAEPAVSEPADERAETETAESTKDEALVADVEPAEETEPAEAKAAPARDSDGEAGGTSVKASPLAKRLAAQLGVDLASLKGSGPEGRIVREDVEAASKGKGGATRPAAAPSRRAEGPETEVIEPSRMQATIARRMAESKSTVPEFTVTVETRVDQAVSMRQQLKDSVQGAEKVTMTDFLVRACALALRKFPEVNTSWVDGKFQRKRSVNIGLAVAPTQGMGLLVPVVHDADIKDIVQISIESRQVIERARSGRPAEGDLTGATFSISNLGMFGVDEFTAIINPPEAAILAVGAIKDAAVVDDGKVAVGKVMRMTLTVDHRVFYGATAAQFMAEVKRLLENPVTLVVPPAS
ncbi:MAG TPA: dihydrolipoamide acetyltransferase family protein [Candidatus Acidoferrum sp.]|jgi:pyruvate dehydrogenase E2 component (dihydrolipoamide acetyltransferase)|nr:dihydrolipoamide acetyltransferase family protein [Candidatus Acidoferrum sp.]